MAGKIDRYDNYDLEVLDNELVIRVNLNEERVATGLSASGAYVVIAATGGIRRIPRTRLKISMNIYREL